MNEFKATHRYKGGDTMVFYFNEGDEVCYVRDWEPTSEYAYYRRAGGQEQIVDKQYMEEL